MFPPEGDGRGRRLMAYFSEEVESQFDILSFLLRNSFVQNSSDICRGF